MHSCLPYEATDNESIRPIVEDTFHEPTIFVYVQCKQKIVK